MTAPESGRCHSALGTLKPMATMLVGAGVYDAQEASHLLALPVECIVRWSVPDRHGLPPVVASSLDRAFSFVDLVSLGVAGVLWHRRVAEVDMRHGVKYLRNMTGYERPLAHRDVVDTLATSGNAFIAELQGGWFDLGKGGQGAFKEIVRIYLKKIEFDDLGVARSWRPAAHVVLDPRVQAGTPCIEGTRIPTETVAAMAEVDSPELVAEDLDLTVEEVLAAAGFEAALLEGQGIAA
jgi:uncharacterized protein (DUF433 family)